MCVLKENKKVNSKNIKNELELNMVLTGFLEELEPDEIYETMGLDYSDIKQYLTQARLIYSKLTTWIGRTSESKKWVKKKRLLMGLQS